MSQQYLRAYELIVIPAEGDAVIIKNLKIIFDITKSLISIPNLAKIEIYNPGEKILSVLQKKFTKIQLSAGYGNNIGLIFKGEIRNTFQSRKGVDKVATIYSGDGEKDWQNAIFNKTYTENISIKTIIQDLFKTFKNSGLGDLDGIPDVKDKLRGQALSGSSKDILDKYADEYNFEWSIQDGNIIVSKNDGLLRKNEAVLINSKTGMIGTPTVTEIGADVTTLLNPKLLPNFGFKIESINAEFQIGNLFFRDIKRTSAEGLYKVQEVNFRGDSREGEWIAGVKGRTVNVL